MFEGDKFKHCIDDIYQLDWVSSSKFNPFPGNPISFLWCVCVYGKFCAIAFHTRQSLSLFLVYTYFIRWHSILVCVLNRKKTETPNLFFWRWTLILTVHIQTHTHSLATHKYIHKYKFEPKKKTELTFCVPYIKNLVEIHV